ncbi:hypothetical protein ACLB2K_011287 [Fragaria x ananassa]
MYTTCPNGPTRWAQDKTKSEGPEGGPCLFLRPETGLPCRAAVAVTPDKLTASDHHSRALHTRQTHRPVITSPLPSLHRFNFRSQKKIEAWIPKYPFSSVFGFPLELKYAMRKNNVHEPCVQVPCLAYQNWPTESPSRPSTPPAMVRCYTFP